MPDPTPHSTGRPSPAPPPLSGPSPSRADTASNHAQEVTTDPQVTTSTPVPSPSPASTRTHHRVAATGEVASRTDSGGPVGPDGSSDVWHAVQAVASGGAAESLTVRPATGESTDDAPTIITGQRSGPVPLPPLGADPGGIAGRQLGPYVLIEAIGSGGMATVFKAQDQMLGRVVALKILPPQAARDPENVARFQREARAAARLNHDNIARVYSYGEDQGLHFIAFELVEGENLRQKIERRKTISPIDCVSYMLQAAAGLAHAYAQGVVHRDIKPSNIIITPEGRAKIVDMGLARLADVVPANGGVTQSGVTLGTFDYISPEQALDPRQADIRSDIYSLGCTFYHALTGRPPVPEGTAARKLHAHQHLSPPDPRLFNPSIPEGLVDLLDRMMAKDPKQRPQSPAEVIGHLKVLAQQLELAPDAVTQDSVVLSVPAAPSVPRPPQLRVGWVLAAAAVVVAGTALALSSAGSPPLAPVPPPWAVEPTDTDAGPVPGLSSEPSAPPPTAPAADGIIRTAEQLAARLNAADPNGPPLRLRLAAAEFDLTTVTVPIVCRAREVELTGSVSPPTVLRVWPTSPRSAVGPGQLVFRGAETVTLTGIRVETAAVAPASPPPTDVALLVAEAAAVRLTDCVFVAAPVGRVTPGAVRLTRLSAEGTGISPQVVLERCLFARGEFALAVPDAADIRVTDSGFGPHGVVLRIGESIEAEAVPVRPRKVAARLDRSSFMLEATSAVVAEAPDEPLAPEAVVEVTAGYCVFAHTPLGTRPSPPPDLRKPVLVRTTAGHATVIRYKGSPGRKNVYYRVEALGLGPAAGPISYRSFDDCKRENWPIEDAGAVALTRQPWAEPNLLATLTAPEPWRAFGLRTDDAALAADNKVVIVGAQFHEADRIHRAYPNQYWPLDLPKASPLERRTLVWEPAARDDELPKDTFNDLAFLLTKVRSGDEVLIRHTGPVPVERVELKPRNGVGESGPLRVTFKPYPGHQPVLTAAGDEKLNQALFIVSAGSVRFEDLHFVLKPSRPRKPQRVAAAQLAEGAEACSFVGCTFTLAEEDEGRAAAVLIDDPDNEMMMTGTPRTTPRVRFERCVLRGKGRGVWLPVSRPVELEVHQSLTALDGPVYLAEPGGKLPPAARSQLRLSRVTAFVGGPMVEMHGGKVGEMRKSGLVPLEVQADACLFVAMPAAGRGLVEFDAIDAAEVEAKLLEWRSPTPNRYADFDPTVPVMTLRPASEGQPPKEWYWDQWITFAGEAGGKPFGTVILARPPKDLKALAAIRPADAVVQSVDFPDLNDAKPGDAGCSDRLPLPPAEP